MILYLRLGLSHFEAPPPKVEFLEEIYNTVQWKWSMKSWEWQNGLEKKMNEVKTLIPSTVQQEVGT